MPTTTRPTPVSATPAAHPTEAVRHFSDLLRYETDCADVHASHKRRDYVLLDVRSPELYEQGHVPGARNLPHGRIVERNLAEFAEDALFVVYCSGPHCNGADKGALALARLGRSVKKMIGGVTGWIDEGFELTVGKEPS